jgi:hypothetical protein
MKDAGIWLWLATGVAAAGLLVALAGLVRESRSRPRPTKEA